MHNYWKCMDQLESEITAMSHWSAIFWQLGVIAWIYIMTCAASFSPEN